MDVRLAVASRREVRRYAPDPLPGEVVTRILDAGRLAGSGSNRQPWQFLIPESRERIEHLAAAVFAPANVLGATLVVAIVVRGKGPISFDAGRAAQNMLLQAWSEGVGVALPSAALGKTAPSPPGRKALKDASAEALARERESIKSAAAR